MVTVKIVLELCTKAKTLWNDGTVEEKLEYLKTICSNQLLDGATVRYEMKKPFATVASMKGIENWRPHGDSNPGLRREREEIQNGVSDQPPSENSGEKVLERYPTLSNLSKKFSIILQAVAGACSARP